MKREKNVFSLINAWGKKTFLKCFIWTNASNVDWASRNVDFVIEAKNWLHITLSKTTKNLSIIVDNNNNNILGRRSDYTLITKHSQTLNHFTEQYDSNANESVKKSASTFDYQSIASSSNTSSAEHLSNAQTSVTAKNNVIYTAYGFQVSALRAYLFYSLSVLLIGIPYILFKWFPLTWIRLKYRPCDLNESDKIFGK